MKEIKITPPAGYIIDQENSTFDCIKFKPVKKVLTYEDITKKLFYDKTIFYIRGDGAVDTFPCVGNFINLNNCTSEKQAQKLLAMNQLMNVAKYLNGSWKPDWDSFTEVKYYIRVNKDCKKAKVSKVYSVKCMDIYFKSEELAEQAIEILGEETIRLALSTDW